MDLRGGDEIGPLNQALRHAAKSQGFRSYFTASWEEAEESGTRTAVVRSMNDNEGLLLAEILQKKKEFGGFSFKTVELL